MSSELTYADRVGVALLNLKIGEKYIIEEKIKPENRKTFVEIVKSYISRNFLKNEGYEILFTNDYKSVYKLKYDLK